MSTFERLVIVFLAVISAPIWLPLVATVLLAIIGAIGAIIIGVRGGIARLVRRRRPALRNRHR